MNTLPAPLGRIYLLLLGLPLMVGLGVFLADTSIETKLATTGLIIGLVILPLFLRFHQLFVIGTIALAVNAFFLPGQPRLWIPLACGSLFLSILRRIMDPHDRLRGEQGLTVSLIMLGAVVLFTAYMTGGIGSRALGSDVWGGKRYLGVFGAIIVFFAISCRPIRQHLRKRAASLYVLAGASGAMSNLIYLAGPAFGFLYLVFPVELASFQFEQAEIARYNGLTWFCLAFLYFMLQKYGLRGILSPEHWWRVVIFLGFLALSFLGGFRSTLIMIALLIVAQFVLERMFTVKYLGSALAAMTVFLVVAIGFTERLPLSVQRALTVLPIKVDQRAERDARGTLHWRLEMWQVVAPEVPKYLLLGKGYSYSGTDVLLTRLGYQRGMIKASYEDTLISGNYHQGLLTLIIPFGLAGLLAFLAFVFFGFRVLWRNYRHGSPDMHHVNVFLLAFFSSRLMFYLVFYGQFELDLVIFTSTVALSMALNPGEEDAGHEQLHSART